jgi:imidazolonepropionase-like amidohydrolase
MMDRFLFILIGTLVLISPPPICAQEADAEEPPPDHWSIIHAGTLLGIPGEAPNERQSIVIKNDRVDRVVAGYSTAGELALETADVIDLKEYFVLPGLIDVHVHLTAERGKTYSAPDEAKDLYRLTTGIVNARKTLQAGYTTVRNAGSPGFVIFALKDGIEAGDLEGPRMFVAGNTVRIGTDEGPGSCYSVETCRQAVRRQIAKGADFIKVYSTCSGAYPCSHQKAPPLFLMDELQAVVETARTRELKVGAHAHPTAGVNAALEAGVDSVEHGTFADEESISLFLQNGAYLVPTLMVQDLIRETLRDRPVEVQPVVESVIDQQPGRALEAYKAGVMIASGSDAGVVPHGKNARELEWYVDIGIPEMDAIVTATVNAAKLLAREKDLGTLEAGKFADVIAVSGNPLEEISALYEVEFVMKAGKVYKNDH